MSEIVDTLSMLDAASVPAVYSEPASVVESTEVTPERMENMRGAFRLHLGGHTYEQIAETMSVSRASVGRLLADYRELYRRGLEDSPKLHLVAERLREYESIAKAALRDAEMATSERNRSQHRRDALAALRAYDSLALDSGVFNKEADKVFSISAEYKPESMKEAAKVSATKDELLTDIKQLLENGRRLR